MPAGLQTPISTAASRCKALRRRWMWPVILIGIGSNLPSTVGPPLATCQAALAAFKSENIALIALSSWYASAPVPASDQPDFVNSVARIETNHRPEQLLAALHRIESLFGRVRGAPNQARTLDLDLLDYDGLIQSGPPVLPHPRLAQRAFVLAPLIDVAPHWRHPVGHQSAKELIEKIKPDQGVRRILPV